MTSPIVQPTLGWIDYVTIAVYFVVVLIVGLWATFRPNRDSSEGYFLAGKDMTWFPVGASLFATNCGAQTFIGITGSAAASGLSVAVYDLHAVYLLIFMGWICVPIYTACGAYTVPQYIRRRFHSRRLQTALATIALLSYISNLIASQIFTGTMVLRYLLGWNIYLSVFAILAVTTVYTVIGGLAAVMYTDTLQTFIFMTGALIVLVQSMKVIGGWENLVRKYSIAAANLTFNDTEKYSCGLPPVNAFHILRPSSDPQIPWTGAVTGLTLMGMNYWCFDQVEVQRGLSAKSISHVKAGALLCGLLKLSAAICFVIPGMVSRAIYPDVIACADPDICREICQNPSGCWNIAYPQLIINLLPAGLQGLMLAAILAAVMSTLTSVFNSSSALFTIDIWKNIRPQATEKETMMVSRTCVLVLMALSILWLPVLELSPGGRLWDTIQRVAAYCNTPGAVVLLFAIFWKRTSEAGAFWGLISGLFIGISRLGLDFAYPSPMCGSGLSDTRPELISGINYLHTGAIIGLIVAGVVILVSLGTIPIPEDKLQRLTWWTRNAADIPVYADVENSRINQPSTETTPTKRRKLAKFDKLNEVVLVWICGLTDSPKQELRPEEEVRIQKQRTSLKEDQTSRIVVNILAVAISVVTTTVLGFFA